MIVTHPKSFNTALSERVVVKQIKIEDGVHNDLEQLGNKSQTYSDVIKMLIEFYKEKHE